MLLFIFSLEIPMQIQMTPELQSALLNRLKSELSETTLANFCLDMIGDDLIRQMQNLQEHNTALLARIEAQDKRIAEMQEQLAPGRRFNNPTKRKA